MTVAGVRTRTTCPPGVMPLTGHKKHQPAESKPLVGMPGKRTVCPPREVSRRQSVVSNQLPAISDRQDSPAIQAFPEKPQSGARMQPTAQAVAKRSKTCGYESFDFSTQVIVRK